ALSPTRIDGVCQSAIDIDTRHFFQADEPAFWIVALPVGHFVAVADAAEPIPGIRHDLDGVDVPVGKSIDPLAVGGGDAFRAHGEFATVARVEHELAAFFLAQRNVLLVDAFLADDAVEPARADPAFHV